VNLTAQIVNIATQVVNLAETSSVGGALLKSDDRLRGV
jgi:hypothetical protein